MRKPFNKVSLLLLLVLVVLLCLDAYSGWIKYREYQDGIHGLEPVLEAAASAIRQAAYLGGFAALIEIFDQIRWHHRDRGPA